MSPSTPMTRSNASKRASRAATAITLLALLVAPVAAQQLHNDRGAEELGRAPTDAAQPSRGGRSSTIFGALLPRRLRLTSSVLTPFHGLFAAPAQCPAECCPAGPAVAGTGTSAPSSTPVRASSRPSMRAHFREPPRRRRRTRRAAEDFAGAVAVLLVAVGLYTVYKAAKVRLPTLTRSDVLQTL